MEGAEDQAHLSPGRPVLSWRNGMGCWVSLSRAGVPKGRSPTWLATSSGHWFPFRFSTKGPWTGHWCEAARIFQNCESNDFLLKLLSIAIFTIEKIDTLQCTYMGY